MDQPAPSLKIGFLGAGKMATALTSGFCAARLSAPELILASDVVPAAADGFARQTGCRITRSNLDVVRHADVLFLAVKPQMMAGLLAEIASTVHPGQLIISIAAGITLNTLKQALGANQRLVRVMPNTPCLVRESASGFSLGGAATPADQDLVQRLLSGVGIAYAVSESLLDAVTGLSGSGPAFVYIMLEALSDGGVRAGLPREVATRLAAQTMVGAAKMVLQTGEHPGSLKDAVASPGGTTIAGLHELERGAVRASLMNAVVAATNRARELGQG